LKKRRQNQHLSDRRNGPNGAEECCSFSATQGPLEKVIHHELVAVLQENAVSYSSATRFCREAILSLNSEEASSSPKDEGLDEVKEAILLALSDEPLSSGRQTACEICLPKRTVYRRLVDSLHLTVTHQMSPLGSSEAFRQSEGKSSRIELSCRSNFAISCCPSGIKDRMGMHITCISL
jgi:hypothetical protein